MAAAFVRSQVLQPGLLAGGGLCPRRDRADAIIFECPVRGWFSFRRHVGSALRRIEPRSDDHWENKFIPAVQVSQGVKIFDAHINFPARLDVRDRLGKDVGPFLGQQRSDITLASRLEVNPLRLATLANDPANAPLADGHDKLIDRGVVGQGKDIEGLDIALIRIVERLCDFNRGDAAADESLDVGVFQG